MAAKPCEYQRYSADRQLAARNPSRAASKSVAVARAPQNPWMNRLAKLVEHMHQRPPRMTPGHSRTRITHDVTNAGPGFRLVAVDGTVGAGRLFVTIRALRQPTFRVPHQRGAIFAQRTRRVLMVCPAINACHAHHGIVFTFETSGQRVHAISLTKTHRRGLIPVKRFRECASNPKATRRHAVRAGRLPRAVG